MTENKRYDVKITILKTSFNKKLIEEHADEPKKWTKCPIFKEGNEFTVKSNEPWKMPQEFSGWVWADIQKMVWGTARDGPKKFITSCTDGFRPVIFKIERIEEEKNKRKKQQLIIKGERINLVEFNQKHLNNPNYLNWLRDYEVIKFINRPEYLKGISFKEVQNYVENITKSERNLFFAIETKNGEFLGTFKIGNIDEVSKHANLGILIGDRNVWGKGIATEAFRTAFNYCFNELELHKVFGGCTEKNFSMKKVFEKLGFTQEGFLREQDLFENQFLGHYYFGLLKKEYKRINF